MEPLPPFEAYRSYLKVIAVARLPAQVRRYVDDSDVVQQTLLEAHRGRAAFRGATPAAQKAWLRRILARNLADAVRALRRDRRDVRQERPFLDALDRTSARLEHWLADGLLRPEERLEENERATALASAIDALPSDQRLAVILRHLNGLDLPAIAQQLDRSPQAVAGLIHRGLTRLREALESDAAP